MIETELTIGQGIPEGLDVAPRHFVLWMGDKRVRIGTLEGPGEEQIVPERCEQLKHSAKSELKRVIQERRRKGLTERRQGG